MAMTIKTSEPTATATIISGTVMPRAALERKKGLFKPGVSPMGKVFIFRFVPNAELEMFRFILKSGCRDQ
jgi:hypothetical protein